VISCILIQQKLQSMHDCVVGLSHTCISLVTLLLLIIPWLVLLL